MGADGAKSQSGEVQSVRGASYTAGATKVRTEREQVYVEHRSSPVTHEYRTESA